MLGAAAIDTDSDANPLGIEVDSGVLSSWKDDPNWLAAGDKAPDEDDEPTLIAARGEIEPGGAEEGTGDGETKEHGEGQACAAETRRLSQLPLAFSRPYLLPLAPFVQWHALP